MSKKDKIIVVVVGVIIKKGKVLFSLRKDDEVKEADSQWELPGGKIEFGETATECLMREIREETSLIVKPVKLVDCIWSNIWQTKDGGKIQPILIPFLCELESGVERPDKKEVQEIKWFLSSELKKLKVLPGTEEMVKAAFLTKKGGYYNVRQQNGL